MLFVAITFDWRQTYARPTDRLIPRLQPLSSRASPETSFRAAATPRRRSHDGPFSQINKSKNRDPALVRYRAVPFSAGGPFSAVEVACHDLCLTEYYCTAIGRFSAGFQFNAGIAVWQGIALMRDLDSL